MDGQGNGLHCSMRDWTWDLQPQGSDLLKWMGKILLSVGSGLIYRPLPLEMTPWWWCIALGVYRTLPISPRSWKVSWSWSEMGVGGSLSTLKGKKLKAEAKIYLGRASWEWFYCWNLILKCLRLTHSRSPNQPAKASDCDGQILCHFWEKKKNHVSCPCSFLREMLKMGFLQECTLVAAKTPSLTVDDGGKGISRYQAPRVQVLPAVVAQEGWADQRHWYDKLLGLSDAKCMEAKMASTSLFAWKGFSNIFCFLWGSDFIYWCLHGVSFLNKAEKGRKEIKTYWM